MSPSPRTWLITGVSTGLGRAIAAAALAAGDRVAGTVRSAEAATAFAALSPNAAAYVMDVRNQAAISTTVAEIEKNWGAIDILVNNAGYGLIGAVEEVNLAEARTQFDVNVFGPMAMIQAVLPGMRARRAGRIVNVTSVSGLATWQGTGVYCASKFALEAIGETLGDEVAPLGIKVINVEPGAIRTDFAGRSLNRAAARIADYEPTAHQSEKILAEKTGQESGDPAKMAAAILSAARMESPPRHLLLGADALHYATRRMGAMLAEFGDWAPVSVGVRFEDQ